MAPRSSWEDLPRLKVRQRRHDVLLARAPAEPVDFEEVQSALAEMLKWNRANCEGLTSNLRSGAQPSFNSRLRDFPCPAAERIPDALGTIEREYGHRLAVLRETFGGDFSRDMESVATLGAWLHGEYVRLRPFEAGNLWAAQFGLARTIREHGFSAVIYPLSAKTASAAKQIQSEYDEAVDDSLSFDDELSNPAADLAMSVWALDQMQRWTNAAQARARRREARRAPDS
jgi:hypothetical protein